MTTAFPLLRLPYLALMPVLEQMELKERIAFSVLSKRARMFLKLLKIKCKYINVILQDNRITMIVFFVSTFAQKLLMIQRIVNQISLHACIFSGFYFLQFIY
ncbi:hypothetical protein CRE_10470 [Caenorhabditis remanei]|uniref:F-box domain-containing protein n=1 Tax=Caenorhabditis remanei TaxID=31234 RepID=E3N0P4_CAERE|nr:hypothetical protein CRE_10470 [Caenorhabditis remanei]